MRPERVSAGNSGREIDGDSILTLVGQWAWGRCNAVDTMGNLLVIGNGLIVHVLSVESPSKPEVIGEYRTDGSVNDIRVQDSIAFVATGLSFLTLDMSDPTNPSLMGRIDLSVSTLVELGDSIAFVATYFNGLYLIDISNPHSPFVRSVAAIGSDPICLAVRDGFAYVGNFGLPRMVIVDATNPDSPASSFLDISPGFATSVSVHGDYLLAGVTPGNIFQVYDLTMPEFPILAGEEIVEEGFSVGGIASRGSTAYATTDSSILIFDISDASNPEMLSKMITGHLAGGASRATSLRGDSFFAAVSFGLLEVNIVNPDSAFQQSYFMTSASMGKVELIDSLAYAASASGLWILDLSDPTAIQAAGSLNTGGTSIDIDVVADIAYVLNGEIFADDPMRGIWAVDVSTPSQPKALSQYLGTVRMRPVDFVVEGGEAYILHNDPALGDTLMEIVNMSDPSNPVRDGLFLGSVSAYAVAVKDSIAFVATSDSGVIILDCHEPSNPVRIGNRLQFTKGVEVKNSLLYVAGDSLYIFDITVPSNPVQIGTSGCGKSDLGYSTTFSTSDGFLYWTSFSVVSHDVSNPQSPGECGAYDYGGIPRGVSADGSLVAVADEVGGLWVFVNNRLVADALNPTVNVPSRIKLFQNFPNPFNPRTRIRFWTSEKQEIKIVAFDALGREVAQLADDTFEAGVHEIALDGSKLSTGTYFVEMISAKEKGTIKIILLK